MAFEDHLDGLARASARLRTEAEEAGVDLPVPTCPGWTVRDLLAHQGMVHRWADSKLRGERVDPREFEREGAASDDLLGWFDAGAEQLATTLRATPADANVRFFLPDSGSGRDAWARRQCHETTIHAVDALSARLGAAPDTTVADLDAALATDGIDELLCGFLPRPDGLTVDRPHVVAIQATDSGAAWQVHLGPHEPVAGPGLPADAETTWTGSAADLYLGLWNRGDAVRETGTPLLEAWRTGMQVNWD
ncbi:maleylpyruvate isomerase family mycothiol-dependent enzyme [Calidifontibacter sp. DB0510]|uniref:Maleylpyruvate isomerase family mycothiol-dependent enzyme n=2 Tax=Metallococcus carri TaxID=1656884 RepID=A0A967B476_9MICO|nr:maleylpyruvate isomerase family mycothiol-dependent enzyme [Metallococcus carri]NOP36864.1 maleylpyruvate isomerase family protein [Calidifontibacter sp. DB2511S]